MCVYVCVHVCVCVCVLVCVRAHMRWGWKGIETELRGKIGRKNKISCSD